MAKYIHKAQEIAKENMQLAQDKMAKNINQYYRKINQTVRDFVYLSTRNLKTNWPSYKLAKQQKGLYKVLEQINYSYCLKLPYGSQIYNIFALDVLTKDLKDLLPRQESEKLSREVITSQEEQNIDKILAIKLVCNTIKYKASQIGYNLDLE